MATRLKTIQYAFPALASMTNNTLTNLAQITVTIPETVVNFRSVILNVSMDDIITVTGGTITTKTIGLRLGASAYTSIANANAYTNSGENLSFFITQNYTSHFTSNWSGTSMTCDVQMQVNQSTGTTLGMVNVCAELVITYEYDDTSTTHIKTVYLPLNAPAGALATTKPGTATSSIPALDSWLPENSVSIKDCYIVLQGNEHRNGATTDHVVYMQIDTLAQLTTGNYEGALASDRWFKYIYSCMSGGATIFTTNATHSFYLWASVARVNHAQAYMVITYTYNEANTTTVLNSLQLPMEFISPMGGTTATDIQSASRELWIQEPDTITIKESALYLFWDQAAAISGLNLKINDGGFTAYTDTASVLCGCNGCMKRAETDLSLSRGLNTLSASVYRTDTVDFGWNLASMWIINYTSGKAITGTGSHNNTIRWNILSWGTVASANNRVIPATSVQIPETDYFINAVGNHCQYVTNTTSTAAGFNLVVERLASEGTHKWESCYVDIAQTDPETGLRQVYSQIRTLFKRFPNDYDSERLDLEVNRRWWTYRANAATGWDVVDVLLTYHTIIYTIEGTISKSGGGTVNLDLIRTSDKQTMKTTSRVGDGTYSFTWYDNTIPVYVSAREDAEHVGRSDQGVAS